MIKINLVSETPAAAPKRKRKVPAISLGAKQGDIILLVVLVIGLAVTGARWYMLTSARDDLRQTERERRAERDELKPFIEKVEELERKRDTLKHRIEVIQQLKENQRGPVRILDEVSRALPELVWLERLQLKGDVLTISGRAMDENAVANYIANLDASPFFRVEPTLNDMTRGAQDTFGFSLTCIFTYAPPEIQQASAAETGP